MNRIPVLSVLVVVAMTSAAVADPDVSAAVSTDRSTHSHLSVTTGLATPVGELGAEYALVVHPHLEVGFGVGLANLIGTASSSLAPDLQVAAMPRFRTRLGAGTLTVGAGLSAGRYTELASPFAGTPFAQQTYALWANGELGYEYATRGGLFVRGFLGFGKVVAHGEVLDSDHQREMTLDDTALPYLGVGVGYAF